MWCVLYIVQSPVQRRAARPSTVSCEEPPRQELSSVECHAGLVICSSLQSRACSVLAGTVSQQSVGNSRDIPVTRY